MSKFNEASDNIKRLAVIFKGLIELSEEIDKLNSLENHLSELEIKKSNLLKVIEGLDKTKLNTEDNIKKLNDVFNLEVEKIQQHKNQEVEKLNKELNQLKQTMSNERSEFSKAMAKLESTAHESLESKKSQCLKLDIDLLEKTKKLEEVTIALEKIKGGI